MMSLNWPDALQSWARYGYFAPRECVCAINIMKKKERFSPRAEVSWRGFLLFRLKEESRWSKSYYAYLTGCEYYSLLQKFKLHQEKFCRSLCSACSCVALLRHQRFSVCNHFVP